MSKESELEVRVATLEEKMDAVIGFVNDLIELIYEPGYVKKLDKCARYGEKDSKQGSDTLRQGRQGA